jgi:hypothetical protein
MGYKYEYKYLQRKVIGNLYPSRFLHLYVQLSIHIHLYYPLTSWYNFCLHFSSSSCSFFDSLELFLQEHMSLLVFFDNERLQKDGRMIRSMTGGCVNMAMMIRGMGVMLMVVRGMGILVLVIRRLRMVLV